MANSPSILIISFSNLGKDPRVDRQIRYLHSLGYGISTLGLGPPAIAVHQHHTVDGSRGGLFHKLRKAAKLATRRHEWIYWSDPLVKNAMQQLQGNSYDIILANDIAALPLALAVKGDAKVILDAHEYAPEEFADRFLWRLLVQNHALHLVENYLPLCDRMLTVCQGIADRYQALTGVRARVVTNATAYRELEPQAVDKGHIRMIYHGVALPSRRVEDAIQCMDHLDQRFQLDMILVGGSKRYRQRLERLASQNKRICLIPPVPMDEIPSFCNSYDIGFYPLANVNINHQYALPNKFFEFIQARVALALYPLPEMARLVKEHHCGVLSEDFSPQSLAKKLNALSSQEIASMKQASHGAARALSAEENLLTLKSIVEELLPCAASQA